MGAHPHTFALNVFEYTDKMESSVTFMLSRRRYYLVEHNLSRAYSYHVVYLINGNNHKIYRPDFEYSSSKLKYKQPVFIRLRNKQSI